MTNREAMLSDGADVERVSDRGEDSRAGGVSAKAPPLGGVAGLTRIVRDPHEDWAV